MSHVSEAINRASKVAVRDRPFVSGHVQPEHVHARGAQFAIISRSHKQRASGAVCSRLIKVTIEREGEQQLFLVQIARGAAMSGSKRTHAAMQGVAVCVAGRLGLGINVDSTASLGDDIIVVPPYPVRAYRRFRSAFQVDWQQESDYGH